MIFHEIYGCYFAAVEKIIARALAGNISEREVREIVDGTAFSESALTVVPALEEGRWPFLRADGSTPLSAAPHAPPTTAQRMFLKAVCLDPRVRLFGEFEVDAEPLFLPSDVVWFDRASDGDPYEDAGYIQRFRMLLAAVKEGREVSVRYRGRSGRVRRAKGTPAVLEYSERDDKFRLRFSGRGGYLNLGRIGEVSFTGRTGDAPLQELPKKRCVVELYDGRSALERFNLAFVHLEKEVERTGEDTYRVTLFYDPEDETEVVIGVLSFGRFVKAVSPAPFVEEIKLRLLRQWRQGLK